MVEIARGAAEDEHVAGPQDEAPAGIAAPRPAEAERGVVAERHRNDRGARVFLILVAMEPQTATDWREQPFNLMPPKGEPTELSRKLALHIWMEQVRALPNRPAFLPQEEALFNVTFEGGEWPAQAPPAWLEPYRDSDSKLVRAVAELKLAALGGQWKPDSVYLLSLGVKHPVVKAKLEELLKNAPKGWTPPPLPPGLKKDEPDAGK